MPLRGGHCCRAAAEVKCVKRTVASCGSCVFCGRLAQLVSALALQARGCQFESDTAHSSEVASQSHIAITCRPRQWRLKRLVYHVSTTTEGVGMRAKCKPSYLLHQRSGQARVRINGRDHYLGPYGSRESRDRYDELVVDWLRSDGSDRFRLTVDDLALLFIRYVEQTYRDAEGKPTSEVGCMRQAIRYAVRYHGCTRLLHFGPKCRKLFDSSRRAARVPPDSLSAPLAPVSGALSGGKSGSGPACRTKISGHDPSRVGPSRRPSSEHVRRTHGRRPAPQLTAMRLARRSIEVALTGSGG